MKSIHNSAQDEWQDVDVQNPATVLLHALNLYHPALTMASSFSIEDAILIHLLARHTRDFRVFAIDTGRLPEETYACSEQIRKKYGITIEWYFPNPTAVERLETTKGLYSFRESMENRKECCAIRKIEPLQRALHGVKAWITGLRREQNITRSELGVVDLDSDHGGIVKVNPLADWTLEQVWAFTRENAIPYNRLYDQGYASIGCAPCTRAVQPGEDQRAGRWWWENPEHKECGLHLAGRQ